MTLLRAADLCLRFGARTLFDKLHFVIEEGERVGLVGANGSGKSTLMRILAGETRADGGLLQLRRGAKVTYLPQAPTFAPGRTVQSVLSVHDQRLQEAIAAHQKLSGELSDAEGTESAAQLTRLSALSDRIEQLGGWDTAFFARKLLDRLGVKDWDNRIEELSGGAQKRVAIAQALLSDSDLLLLDEPTNHLDADTVDWLEGELDQKAKALLLVTHDRYFLDGLVDRIVEIEQGGALTSYPGNYQAYLEQKLTRLEEAHISQHKRERWIAQEVAWLRKGVEARRTKSKARIQRAQALMSEKGFVRPKAVSLEAAATPKSGHKVLEAKGLTKRLAGRALFQDFDFILQAGERIGIVGPNGAGKTTLIRVLLGELPADAGTVELGARVRAAYHDQGREALDPEKTVYESAWTDDWVELNGRKVALRDYLEDLLFPVPMQRMQVKALSGGEKNRLLLARLFLEGANLLVLDEPTNDLDIVTLAVLESLLRQFQGTVLLVTHDRYFLDKVATSILSFEGEGEVIRYAGAFQAYRAARERKEAARAARPADPPGRATAVDAGAAKSKGGKLSYKDQRELDGIEAAIEAAESLRKRLEAELASPENAVRADALEKLSAELSQAAARVEALYARWQELADLQGVKGWGR